MNIVVMPGEYPTLFHLAARVLGNPEFWDKIADINQIDDPFSVGTSPLRVPVITLDRGLASPI